MKKTYNLISDVLKLVEEFNENTTDNNLNIDTFIEWITKNKTQQKIEVKEEYWEGKENGRSIESVINTLIVNLNRYAKYYTKSIIHETEFVTQEDFIYLINLKSLGSMTKIQLIKRNLQDKPTGIQIINRLIKQGWVKQSISTEDKRSHIISITTAGTDYLNTSMDKIRTATTIVAGNLEYEEKMQLLYLLKKLDCFHNKIYHENQPTENLLEFVTHTYFKNDKKQA